MNEPIEDILFIELELKGISEQTAKEQMDYAMFQKEQMYQLT